MSIAEYQWSIKKLIDAATDEALLKRWKTQLEADLAQANKKDSAGETGSSPTATQQGQKAEETEDTSGYDIIESGLGIDE